jgi:4-diphosphocytidyl-2-C-methyl-D-erythritol kinase
MGRFEVLNAYAKVNLFLEIAGKRPDGYHTLDSVMQSVSLSDTVRVELTDGGIELSCSDPTLPCGRENTAVRAAGAFFAASGAGGGCRIRIDKRIPSQAGLGGGSADAAAVLASLERLCGGPLGVSGLRDVAARVGSDVPFCLAGGLRRVGGAGELTGPRLNGPKLHLLISKPVMGISTPGAYSELDRLHGNFLGHEAERPDRLMCALDSGCAGTVADGLYNRFEEVLPTVCPAAGDFLAGLRRLFGRALMSGSGSSAFAVFGTEEEAVCALGRVREAFPSAFAGVYFTVSDGVSVIAAGEE